MIEPYAFSHEISAFIYIIGKNNILELTFWDHSQFGLIVKLLTENTNLAKGLHCWHA